MIIEFRLKNYLSILEEQVLNFEADKGNKKYSEYFVKEIGDYSLLKMIGIYGPNASGKTNVVESLDILRRIILNRNADLIKSMTHAAYPEYNDGLTEFGLDFFVKMNQKYIRHKYNIKIDTKKNKIMYEKLVCYTSSQPTTIYTRVSNDVSDRKIDIFIGQKQKVKKADLESIKINTLEHTTVLSVFKVIAPLFPNLKSVYDWFNQFLLPLFFPNSKVFNNSMGKFLSTDENAKYIVKFLKNANMDIHDLFVKKSEEEEPNELNGFTSLVAKTFGNILPDFSIENEKIVKYETHLEHISFEKGKEIHYSLPLEMESLGTKRLLNIAYPTTLAILHPSLLLVDEIENSLHLQLIKYVLSVFLSNSEESQIVFTTHNLNLLDWEIMRNDVIWFTEKKNGMTQLYPLSDFKGLNRLNVWKEYQAGSFGAFPDVYQYKFKSEELKKLNL